jgi:hypothetical protein
MNVISYEIEIKRSKLLGFNLSDKEKGVFDLVANSFGDELEIKNKNLQESIETEWEEIGYSELKAIFNKKNCCGYSTTENLKLFLFEKSNSAARSKNNITVDLIAFGKLDATKILNHSYVKIKNIISSKKLTCSYIDGAQAFIYPFDTQRNDIYSYELKVKADLISRFTINNKVYSRWIIMIIGFLVALILKTSGKSTTETDQATNVSGVMDSIIAAFVFYLLVELVIYYVIPFFTQKSKKHLKISNLSSFVESGNSNSGTHDSESNTNFETPNI